MQGFSNILILLASAVVMISVCRRAHLPPIIGYLIVGLIVGPGGLGWIPSIDEMHFFAEFGVVFLMFTLGLEFSIPRLLAAKKYLLGLGSIQVVACTAIGMLVGMWFGLDPKQAFIIGAALSLSSTAVVVKQLSEQKEQGTPHGSLAINILLFQDIAAVLLLIIMPALSSGSGANALYLTFLITFLKGVGAVIVMALIGLWVLRPLFREVAKAHSTELFMLATLLVVLSAAGITYALDLSMALGAFLAGLLLGETEFRHQIEIDIRPFRDVLLGLFFIVIGAYLDLRALPENWLYILVILIALIVGKTLIIMLITMLLSKKGKKMAFKTGFVLAHGGEFSFVVLTLAIQHQLISQSQRSAIFSALVISILLAPLMIRFNKKISRKIFTPALKDDGDIDIPELAEHAAELKKHVIICGFGRVGQILARFLDQENIPWVALDLDPRRISKASTAGEQTFYGNATNPETLIAAGLSRARMIVISFDDDACALEVVAYVRAMRVDLPIFVRTGDDNNLEEFQKAGATEVVPEILEGSLMLASHLLLALGVSPVKIINKIREVHSDRYDVMRGFYKGEDEFTELEANEFVRRSLHSIIVNEDARCIDKTLKDLVPESEDPPVIKTIIRDDKRFPDPNLNMMIQAGDVIVAFANPEEFYIIEEKILGKHL